MAQYPKELPVFEIVDGCADCIGRHSEGSPTRWGGDRIDVWSCVGFFEPFDISSLKPLNTAARLMIKAVRNGVEFPPGIY